MRIVLFGLVLMAVAACQQVANSSGTNASPSARESQAQPQTLPPSNAQPPAFCFIDERWRTLAGEVLARQIEVVEDRTGYTGHLTIGETGPDGVLGTTDDVPGEFMVNKTLPNGATIEYVSLSQYQSRETITVKKIGKSPDESITLVFDEAGTDSLWGTTDDQARSLTKVVATHSWNFDYPSAGTDQRWGSGDDVYQSWQYHWEKELAEDKRVAYFASSFNLQSAFTEYVDYGNTTVSTIYQIPFVPSLDEQLTIEKLQGWSAYATPATSGLAIRKSHDPETGETLEEYFDVGADGVWETSDDRLLYAYSRSYIKHVVPGTYSYVERWAGEDMQVGTGDDFVYGIRFVPIRTEGSKIYYLVSGSAGLDREFGTEDDPQLVFVAMSTTPTSARLEFLNPGTDGTRLTDDDYPTSIRTYTFDASGLRTYTAEVFAEGGWKQQSKVEVQYGAVSSTMTPLFRNLDIFFPGVWHSVGPTWQSATFEIDLMDESLTFMATRTTDATCQAHPYDSDAISDTLNRLKTSIRF